MKVAVMEGPKADIGVLLRRSSLIPGESFFSLLIRLANANFYDPFSILLDHIRSGGKVGEKVDDKLSYPLLIITYERTAVLAKIDIHKLYAATPHTFAPVLTSPDSRAKPIIIFNDLQVPLLPSGIASKQLRPVQAGQFCPACLRDSKYHRLVWMPAAVSACLEHKCLLLTNCHSCGKKVSVHDIVATQCGSCGSSLTEADTFSLGGDEFGLFTQRLIQLWLISNVALRDPLNLVPEEPPRVLFRLIDGLRQAIITLGNPKWPYLHKVDGIPLELMLGQGKHPLEPYESYCLYTTACKGLIDWPHGFYEFLQAVRMQRKGVQPIHGGPKVDLGNLYTQWLQGYWRHPAFAFVQDAFEKYFVENYWLSSPVIRSAAYQSNSSISSEFTHINIAEAARIMGVTPRWVELLISAGRLSSYTTSDSDRLKFVNKTEVLELRNQWSEYATRTEAATWLGVTEKMITDMVNMGLLEAEFHPSDGFPRWLFSKSAIVSLLENLARHIRGLSAQEEAEHLLIGLIEASRLVYVLGLDATSILKLVVEGKLQAYAACDDKLLLGSLLFARPDLQQCIEDIKSENGWVGREEARRLLGVKDSTLARWVKGGLITPCATFAHVQYFHVSTICQFTANYISSDEAAQILGIGTLAVQKWARTGRLVSSCVSGPEIDGSHTYLFDKGKLQRWRYERLTFGEALRLLGVSKATFHRWVQEKGLEPLDDMGGKQRWFSRQTLFELCEEKSIGY